MQRIKQTILYLTLFLGILIFPKFVFASNITFTLETWLKPATSVATKAILVKNNEMRLVTDGSGNPSCQIYSDSWQTAAVSSAAISTGSWQHVACTYDGTNVKVYVAGALTDTEAETANVNNTANGMIAGYDAGATYGKFEGQIDSVRIFNRALSANEIKAHYDLGSHIQDGDMEDGDAAEFSQASEGSDLLSNAGFETVTGDDFGSWTESVGDGAVASSTTVRAGTYAMKATAGVSANSYAKQAAAVTAGKMYKLTFWTRGDATYGGRYKIYDATGAADIVALGATAVTGTTYAQITKYFTAPAGCSSAEIYLYCPSTNTGISYFDDVSIIEAQAASAEGGTVADEDGLAGGWNFEEASTPSVDVSGNGYNLTWNGTAARVAGRYGYAIDLDGDSDYLNKTDADSLDLSTTATISAWIKLDDLAAQHSLADKGTNYGIHIDTSGYLTWDNGTEYKDTTAISATTWTHIAVTNDGTTAKYYVNGAYSSSDTAGFAAVNASDLRIGYDGTNYFQGLIDSLRIYNRTLSASEIAAHYSLGRGKHDNYAAKIKLAANDSNSYLDETLTNGQDYLASFWYHPGEDNANAIRFKVSGSADPIMAEHNLMASSTMGLVGAWNFESSATPSVDISGNGNSLTWNGTAAQSTSGKFGSAIDLDGDSDYLNKTDADSLDLSTSATISAWIKLDDLAAQHSLIDKGTNYGVHIDTSGYLTWDNGTEYKDTTAISATTWTHIAVTNDGTTAKYYVNGAYSSSDTAGFAAINASDLRVGYDGTNYFQGLIDSLRIYNRALTASEVYDRYKAGDWHKYELSFEADQTGAHLFKFIQDGTTTGNSIVYVDNFRVDKNLVNKGGFEAFAGGDPNIPTGWSNSGLDSTEGVEGTDDYHTGAKSMKFVSADTDEGITQTITVESGKWYTFSGWAKNNNLNLNFVLGDATTAIIDATTANNIWTKFSKTFKSSSTSLTVSPISGADAQTGYFDDISLIELDSYTGATTATTTTPTVAASSYGKGRWGEASGAIMIDGGDTLSYPTANNIYADEGTVAFWVKPGMDYNDFSENKYLWSVEGIARLYYNYSDYKFYFEIYDGSAWDSVQAASSAQNFTEDTWIHISASWNDRKNQVYLYVNGANDGSSTWGWYAQTLPTNMYFGAEYDGTNNADMYFDDVRVYDHSLSAEDAHRMYGSSPDPSASQLRLHIPFTYGGGTGIGVNGTGLYDLTGTFTAGWGYRTGKASGEYALGIFGSDNLQFSRGAQVDGYVYEYMTPYQGTIKTWVKPAFDGSDATTNVIFQNGDASNYIKLYYASGNLYWDVYTTSTTYRTYQSASAWTGGTWYHIAATWNNNAPVNADSTGYLMNLYINGSDASNAYSNVTAGTNFWAPFSPSANSYIGQDKDAANQFNGLIGGFAIDDKAWSEDEVSTDYNSGSGTLTSVSQDTLLYLPADSSDVDGMITWDKSPDVAVADGNMEDGDAAEWSESANGYTSAEGGTIAPEDGLLGGWNYEDDLTDSSGNSKNGTLHTRPSCPTGYVFVPGNSAYSTSDFCVMQYEAKYDSNDDGTGDDAPSSCKYDTNYDTWDWGKDVATGCGYNVNEAARVVSTAAGSPIAGITHTQALTACPAGDHIITNDEWMTIARDIEQVNANWTNGTVGSGCLFRGNSGEITCGYNSSADPDKGTSRNARAKFTLSSGEEIYDISGNVWEHVKVDASDTLISLAEQPEATSDGVNPISDSDAYNWSDFTTGGGLSRWLLNNGTEPPLGYNIFRPSNSSWNASQGMGRIYHSSNSANATKDRVFLRGGKWGNGTYAGAFTLHLIWGTANQGYSVGFRCSR